MKARIPKSFESLPPKEKAVISQMIQEEAYKLADKEHAEVQKIYMQLCCILLHECFGFGEKRLYCFLGNWKRLYRWNSRFSDKESQTKALEDKIKKISVKTAIRQTLSKNYNQIFGG